MAPPIGTQIAVPGFFHQGQRVSPNVSQFREHCVLFAQELWVYGNWRLHANQTHFRKREGQAKSPQHRNVLWLFLKNPVGCRDHRAFNRHDVSDEFGGRPCTLPGTRLPHAGWDSISRPQQVVLRTIQFLEDGFEWRHDAFGEKLTLDDRKSALTARPRQLPRRPAPVAGRGLPQKGDQKSANRPGAFHRFCHKALKSRAPPREIL